MKPFLQLLLAILFLSGCTKEKKELKPFTFPPEWESHQAIWIAVNDQWGDPASAKVQVEARLKLIEVLHNYVPVKLLTTSDSLANVLMNDLSNRAVDTSQITTIIYPERTYFLRDPGPIFISNGKTLKMANWQGIDSTKTEVGSTSRRKNIDDSLALRFNYVVENSPLRYDGGAIEVNTHSAMSIKDYALKLNAPKYSIEEIEKQILSLYGKKQMIWLEGVPLIEKGGLKVDNYWGYAPNGHIDAVARFANDSTILVTTIAASEKDNNPIAQHDYEIFQGYLKQLKQQRRHNGKPFTVVEIPSPDIDLYRMPIPVAYWDKETLEYYEMTHFKPEDTIYVVPATNYANYLVTNGAVLVPEYWEEGMPISEKEKDAQMKSILKTYFPDRAIIGIRSQDLNLYGGGIHCATQQEPKVN